MPAPSTKPEWATDTNYASGPASGTAAKVEPSAGYKAQGNVPGEILSGPYENWWKNLVYEWINWFDTATVSANWANAQTVASVGLDDIVNEIVSDLADNASSTSRGANKIGFMTAVPWQDGGTIAATDVGSAIVEIIGDLGDSTGPNDGAGRIGYDDDSSGTGTTHTSVANALDATFRTDKAQGITSAGAKTFSDGALLSDCNSADRVIRKSGSNTQSIAINPLENCDIEIGGGGQNFWEISLTSGSRHVLKQVYLGGLDTVGAIPLHLPIGALLTSVTVRYICPNGQTITGNVLYIPTLSVLVGGTDNVGSLGSATGTSTSETNLFIDVSPDHRVSASNTYFLRLDVADNAGAAGTRAEVYGAIAGVTYDSSSGLFWNPLS